ncbi:MAG TPA: class III extradiol dioxygenase subunit B-like domain-containing protein [Chloroflexota bacterium]|nr:class III extradiol dioxygenase subunit B-like domain-containing protein [Chloroflexota bacterium]
MGQGQLVSGWIAPHGVVPDMPDEQRQRVPQTDAAMRSAASRVVESNPDVVVLVTPHGFRAAGANTVSLCRHNQVQLSTWYAWRQDELSVESDPELAQLILDAAAELGVEAIGLIYGATSEPSYPMDWGITGPMQYLLQAGFEGSLLPVTFSGRALETEWQFGQVIASGVVRAGRRAALVASSDLSHVHSAKGPYGFKPIAAEFDSVIERAVRSGNLRSLLDLDLNWAKEAAQDGLRSIVILGGAVEELNFESEVLAYEVDVYYGMLTALLSRQGST